MEGATGSTFISWPQSQPVDATNQEAYKLYINRAFWYKVIKCICTAMVTVLLAWG